MSMIATNEVIYQLLKNDYTYVTDAEGEEDCIVRYIDWEKPTENDFLLCCQMSISGEIETCRTDLLGFVNGLPLVFIRFFISL